MPQLLTLSRAAHLTGVSRAALQKRVREGELPSFDGMVSTDDLLSLFPDTCLEDAGAFENHGKNQQGQSGYQEKGRPIYPQL